MLHHDLDSHVIAYRAFINERIIKNRGLAWKEARRFARLTGRYDLLEDAEQDALMKLGEVAGKYDPGMGWAFSTFAVTCIRRNFARFLQRIEKGNRMPGMNRVLNQDYDLDPVNLATASDDTEIRQAWESITQLLEVLNEREREVITMRRLDGNTLEVVGWRFGVGKERIRQIEVAAIKKMRNSAIAKGILDEKPMSASRKYYETKMKPQRAAMRKAMVA